MGRIADHGQASAVVLASTGRTEVEQLERSAARHRSEFVYRGSRRYTSVIAERSSPGAFAASFAKRTRVSQVSGTRVAPYSDSPRSRSFNRSRAAKRAGSWMCPRKPAWRTFRPGAARLRTQKI